MRWLHVILDVPSDLAATSTRFWSGALGWPAGPTWAGDPAFRSFEPPEGSEHAYVHRQVGDHGPRVHIDLEVPDISAETERLRGLGAGVGRRREAWQVLRSPGGLPFCLVTEAARTVPAPVTWGGHRSRLVQVCIDSPRELQDTEVAFWRAATGGRWVANGDDTEFAGKLFPDDGPVQLLLQQLGPDSGATSTTAHIDLGTDDLETETERMTALGATRIAPGRGWNVLRDPVGMIFCVTGNPPD
jgi:hypothetical protein